VATPFRALATPLRRARVRSRRIAHASSAGGGGCGRWRWWRGACTPSSCLAPVRAPAHGPRRLRRRLRRRQRLRQRGGRVGSGGGWWWLGGGMDRARRPQRPEPALELERRRWRRRRLLLPSPPVSVCPRPGRGPLTALPSWVGTVVKECGPPPPTRARPPARGLARLGPAVAPRSRLKPRA
jgi:hypothetical protein